MRVVLTVIRTIAIVIFIASIQPAYSLVHASVAKTITVTVGDNVRGTVDTAGDIIDAAGGVIAHLLPRSPLTSGDAVSGVISVNGDIVDSNGQTFAHALSFTTKTTTTTKKHGNLIGTFPSQPTGQSTKF